MVYGGGYLHASGTPECKDTLCNNVLVLNPCWFLPPQTILRIPMSNPGLVEKIHIGQTRSAGTRVGHAEIRKCA